MHDVVIIGAGPAGMAAAARLAEAGTLRVALVDAGTGFGGQYWRQPAPGTAAPGASPFTEAEIAWAHHDLGSFHRLRDSISAAAGSGRVDLYFQHRVWTVGREGEGFLVHALDAGAPSASAEHPGHRTLRARGIVLATGAYDRQLPFPGWDLPGVMTAGGLQALLKGNGVVAGSRVAVGGTGPFLLPVAAGLAERGAEIAGVFEANSPARWSGHLPAALSQPGKLLEGAGYAMTFARHRVPYRTRTMILAAHGTERVEAVTYAKLDARGRIVAGSERRIPVDAVGVGWGFTPQLELPMALKCATRTDADGSLVAEVDGDQRSTVPGVWIAGEASGVGGSGLSVVEGLIAAESLLAAGSSSARSGGTAGDLPRLRRAAKRYRRFARAMHLAYPLPEGWKDALWEDTLLCRCEEVSVRAVREVCERHGATDARQVKQLSRAGMGWCQGRVCGYASDCLAAEFTGAGGRAGPSVPAERPVAAPIPLGVLATADLGDENAE